mmetsp:Transcript_48679/g.139150  ORF Transcript_48679/g.139150 Transcript_48679/m.139150 type:complete len:404 (+) Transcript_48679:123-1334(+)
MASAPVRRGRPLLVALACATLGCLADDGQCGLGRGSACKLKVGMVGGGTGLWSKVQHWAVHVGNTRRIVAGVLSSQPQKSLKLAREAGITGYKRWQDMLDAWRKGEQDLDYVVVMTRNNEHHAPAKAFAEAGLPVFCEKPMTMTVAEAEDLQQVVQSNHVPFVLAHTYTGQPMMMLAKELVRSGNIGEVRKAEAWYNQDWAAQNTGDTWRFNPEYAGIAGAAADIGTHSFVAATWVSGRSIKRVSARLETFVAGRKLDDSFSAFAELDNGGTAVIQASCVSVGYKNEHGFRIMGSLGALEWSDIAAKVLIHRNATGAKVITLGSEEARNLLTPAIASYGQDGAMALPNLHASLERTIRLRRGEDVPEPFDHPGVREGVASMRFLEAAKASWGRGGEWAEVAPP